MNTSNGYIIKNSAIVSDNKIIHGDVLIKNGRVEKIDHTISEQTNFQEINGEGLHLFPGLIDDQVHFREPGLTHKGEIYTESKAAVAGGVTSYMEMPNVIPQTLTQSLLSDKYGIGANRSLANYSFYMGASNQNLEEVLKTDGQSVCGIKIFMGSSTGDMLVDDEKTLDSIFRNAPILIATHCEDEKTVQANLEAARQQFGEDIPISQHPFIRSGEACYLSSSRAVSLAEKHGTRLHILHISTGKEVGLFVSDTPLREKRITSEACIHHLWFSSEDYPQKGTWIKWNPAIKTKEDREMIWKGLLNNHIDVIATDHAPHTRSEKENKYYKAPSGGPLVQHSLCAMLDFHHQGRISLERIAEKCSHAVAECFQIRDRGYIREGYYADLVLVDLNRPWSVNRENILAKCGWSPFEGHEFKTSVLKVFVNGHLAYNEGKFDESRMGMRLLFDRD